MKTIYILSCYLSIILVGCTNEVDSLFPTSPAERINNSLQLNADSLQNAPNGWAMEYFANDLNAGYTLLVKFNPSGNAIIAGKNDLTNNILLSDTSMYQMIGDNGPVLSFNMYNKLLHAFSNPVNPDGYGLEGDYEFVVMKTTANQIVLKGKKRATTILLNKLPEGISWKQYFDDLDAMNVLLFGNNAPALKLNLTNKYNFSEGASHIFNVLQHNADANTSIEVPFIITRTGLRFQSAQELDGLSFQTFSLNVDSSALESIENPTVRLTGVDSLSAYFYGSASSWVIDPLKISEKMNATYVQLSKSLIAKYKAANIKLALRYNLSRKSHDLLISFTSSKNTISALLYFNLTIDNEQGVTFNYNGTGDKNGQSFYSNMGGCKELVDILSSSFDISTTTAINPKNITFIQKQDASLWFKVSAE